MDTPVANKELALRFMRAAQAGDLGRMAECLVEDYVQTFPRPGIPGMAHGVEGRDRLLQFLAALPVYETGSMKIEVENVLAEGPMVVVQYKMRARTTRGEDYENFYVQVFLCGDGKIKRGWEYCDTLYATRKLAPELLS